MSRSGYSDDHDECESYPYALYRQSLKKAMAGKRGQEFFRELATAMDAMSVKELIDGELVTHEGAACAMGVVCKSRGIDVSNIDYEDPVAVSRMLNIAPSMAREIAYENDDEFDASGVVDETPSQRWKRMRLWVAKQLGERDD